MTELCPTTLHSLVVTDTGMILCHSQPPYQFWIMKNLTLVGQKKFPIYQVYHLEPPVKLREIAMRCDLHRSDYWKHFGFLLEEGNAVMDFELTDNGTIKRVMYKPATEDCKKRVRFHCCFRKTFEVDYEIEATPAIPPLTVPDPLSDPWNLLQYECLCVLQTITAMEHLKSHAGYPTVKSVVRSLLKNAHWVNDEYARDDLRTPFHLICPPYKYKILDEEYMYDNVVGKTQYMFFMKEGNHFMTSAYYGIGHPAVWKSLLKRDGIKLALMREDAGFVAPD